MIAGGLGNQVITYSMKKAKVSLQPIKRTLPAKKRVRKKKLHNHPLPPSKSVRILDMIEATGQVGMSTTQIRKALWIMTYPDEPFEQKNLRGYWSTNLTGSNVRAGLLTFFCTKRGRRWIRNAVSHENSPWKVMDKAKGFKHISRAKNPWTVSPGSQMGMYGTYIMSYTGPMNP